MSLDKIEVKIKEVIGYTFSCSEDISANLEWSHRPHCHKNILQITGPGRILTNKILAIIKIGIIKRTTQKYIW